MLQVGDEVGGLLDADGEAQQVLCNDGVPAFDAGAAVPAADFKLTAGDELIQDYHSSPDVNRRFCRVCGSRVPSQARDGELWFMPAGLFDDDPGVKPALHIFVGSKAPWWEIGDERPRFEKWVPGYGPDDGG